MPTVADDCICVRLKDTGGYRIADLGCPVHGVEGTDPGDGYWDDEDTDVSPAVTNLPTRPQNGWCVCTHPVDHHSYSKKRCLTDCGCKKADVLMTREEFYASLDVAAAINHLEWLRGLQLTTGSMAEVLSASVDGVWGGEDDEL